MTTARVSMLYVAKAAPVLSPTTNNSVLRFTEDEFRLFSEKRGRKSRRSDVVPTPVTKPSPHAISLAYFAKHPEKVSGNQEHIEQCRLFEHFYLHSAEIYGHLHATPNGGLRAKATAGKMKAEGQKKGYPDMSLDIPCGTFHGMRIELKATDGGKPTVEQVEWLNRLSRQGYYCVLCYGADQAIRAINEYIALNKSQHIEQHLNDSLWKAA